MKKIFAILAASVMMLVGVDAYAQMSVGAGYLNSVSRNKTTGRNTPSNGFYAGAEYNITEGTGFGVSVGAYYSYLQANNDYFGVVSTKIKDMYIDMPVNFNYSIPMTEALSAYVYAGPTFSVGLSSKTQAGALGYTADGKDQYQNGNLNRFDILVGGGAGIDYNNTIRFSVGYNIGCLNRSSYEETTLNRNVLHVGVAFLF